VGGGLTKGRLLYQISEEKNQYNTSFRSNISSEESDQIRVVTSGGRGVIKGRLLNCTRLIHCEYLAKLQLPVLYFLVLTATFYLQEKCIFF
jgi:hypothetical protein